MGLKGRPHLTNYMGEALGLSNIEIAFLRRRASAMEDARDLIAAYERARTTRKDWAIAVFKQSLENFRIAHKKELKLFTADRSEFEAKPWTQHKDRSRKYATG